MKKITKKIIFSALALALAVVTLTTTTYAWYTSSTTATGAGQSQTSASTTDSTLLISTDNSVWGKSVTVNSTSQMVPVQWTGSAFEPLEGETEITTSDYYQFTIYFKTSKTLIDGTNPDIPVYLKKFVLTNTTDELPAYDNLLGTTNTVTGAPNNKDYKVDAVRALDLLLTAGEKDKVATASKMYDLSGTQSYQLAKEGGFNNIASANALAYYNAAMDKTEDNKLTIPASEAFEKDGEGKLVNVNGGSFVVTTLSAGATAYEVQAVTFTIYLNGWDNYCFDACKGQTFDLELLFSTQ